jgi:ABC-type multidrug transport system ATPase subunit
LSRGLLQRAAITRALLHRPRVLLLDEPFTALDAAAAARLRQLLRERLTEGLGMVIVTHHLAEVWEIATRVAVMVDGRWVSDQARTGSLEEFLPRYRTWIDA